jgi:hypothetical protein
VPAGRGSVVAGELDEVQLVDDRDRPGEVGDEDEARLQQPDQEKVAAGVVLRDLRAELGDPGTELPGREKDVPDCRISFYEARSRRNRWASRSMSRL